MIKLLNKVLKLFYLIISIIFTIYDLRLAYFRFSMVCKINHFRNYATEFEFFIITTCWYQWYFANNESIMSLFVKVMILFWALRNRFFTNKFRNYHEVTHSDRWEGISSCRELCLLHFVKFSTLEISCSIVYGQITKTLTEWKIVNWP